MAAKKKEEMLHVWTQIAMHGFTKTFKDNEFPEIENQTFQRLRLAYLKSRDRLTNYIIKRLPK